MTRFEQCLYMVDGGRLHDLGSIGSGVLILRFASESANRYVIQIGVAGGFSASTASRSIATKIVRNFLSFFEDFHLTRSQGVGNLGLLTQLLRHLREFDSPLRSEQQVEFAVSRRLWPFLGLSFLLLDRGHVSGDYLLDISIVSNRFIEGLSKQFNLPINPPLGLEIASLLLRPMNHCDVRTHHDSQNCDDQDRARSESLGQLSLQGRNSN